ncbi:hypothetical protein G7Z17_g4405 [Cylindrodendrum hubeiense]|uniref:Phospholipase A2 n=1 Tax=Cylindrodendrum hubeiense TaxID=595255 RepID=A0A9P5HJ72_9HYPO|nr:hypothetical protein G7Z17_g4405 [Cylindrodendrum hubeiense]
MMTIKSIVVLAALSFTQVNAGPCKVSSYALDTTGFSTLSAATSGSDATTLTNSETAGSSTLSSATSDSDATTLTSSETTGSSTLSFATSDLDTTGSSTLRVATSGSDTSTLASSETTGLSTAEASPSCVDECARGVAGTNLPPAVSATRLAQCFTYLRSTETPVASTEYVTETEYSTFIEGSTTTTAVPPAGSSLKKRVIPVTTRSLPTYAGACPEESDYRSACFCIGASVTTYIEVADTVTSTVISTSVLTLPLDSPSLVQTSSVELPTNADWLSDYAYYEVELPTFAETAAPEFTFAPAEPIEKDCVVDASNSAAEFKPSDGPSGIYDVVLVDGNTKLYIAKKADSGEVVFTTQSTHGSVQNNLITTIFSVSCGGEMEIVVDNTSYKWRSTDDGSELIVADGTNHGTIVLLPKDAFTPLETVPAPTPKMRRTYAAEGSAPRCPNRPADIIATLKSGARGNNPNGCGSDNGIGSYVPDWNYGTCCDGHDNCYDECSETFETCNDVFLTCMRGKSLAGLSWHG